MATRTGLRNYEVVGRADRKLLRFARYNARTGVPPRGINVACKQIVREFIGKRFIGCVYELSFCYFFAFGKISIVPFVLVKRGGLLFPEGSLPPCSTAQAKGWGKKIRGPTPQKFWTHTLMYFNEGLYFF